MKRTMRVRTGVWWSQKSIFSRFTSEKVRFARRYKRFEDSSGRSYSSVSVDTFAKIKTRFTTRKNRIARPQTRIAGSSSKLDSSALYTFLFNFAIFLVHHHFSSFGGRLMCRRRRTFRVLRWGRKLKPWIRGIDTVMIISWRKIDKVVKSLKLDRRGAWTWKHGTDRIIAVKKEGYKRCVTSSRDAITTSPRARVQLIFLLTTYTIRSKSNLARLHINHLSISIMISS